MRAERIRRGGVVALAVVLVALLAIVGAVSGSLSAQAAPVVGVATPTAKAVTSASSRVIVSWDGTTETIEVALGITGATGNVGLVIPTPSKATLSAGNAALFDAAAQASAPIQNREDDWWGRRAHAVAPAASVVSPPLGTLAPTRVSATNKSGLSKWLKKHSLALSDTDRAEIADYASDGWSLTLVSLTVTSPGAIAPLQLKFATKHAVLPMRLAASGKSATSVRIYSFGAHRTALRLAGTSKNPDAAQSVVWAGPVAAPALRFLGDYLTVTDLRFDSPDSQVSGDIGFVNAAADDTLIPAVVVYTPVRLLGFPLGWLLVIWGSIGVLVAAAYLVNRFRAQ